MVQNPYLSGEQAANVSSGNWAGLAQVGATYTGVSASWTVPTILSTPSTAVSSSWIGIDGFSNQDLIQAGTEQDISGGVASYYAWWEILPASETVIGGVNPGDHMTADIFQVSSSTWTIDISDVTANHSFSQNFTYSGPADSAEWIEEMTSVSSGPVPLANFGDHELHQPELHRHPIRRVTRRRSSAWRTRHTQPLPFQRSRALPISM